MNESKIGMILTLGGAPEPLAVSIIRFRPMTILILASQQTRQILEQVQQKVNEGGGIWPTYIELVIIEDVQDYASCFNTMRSKIPKWQAKHQLPNQDVVVDATGGTKPMTASLFLYGASRFKRFVYIGGEGRTKGGTGIVESGNERVIIFKNPEILTFDDYLSRWRKFSSLCSYEALSREATDIGIMFQLGTRENLICEMISKVYRMFASYDRCDWNKKLLKSFEGCIGRMKDYLAFGSEEFKTWFCDIESLHQHFVGITSNPKEPDEIIKALFAAAVRRAECQQKYEESVAILYSTFERLAQNHVKREFGHDTSDFPIELVPEHLRDIFISRYSNGKTLKFGLDAAMKLLASKGLPQGEKYLEHNGIWLDGRRSPLKRRNDSILGHGLQPIRKNDYDELKEKMTELWNINQDEIPRIPLSPVTPLA